MLTLLSHTTGYKLFRARRDTPAQPHNGLQAFKGERRYSCSATQRVTSFLGREKILLLSHTTGYKLFRARRDTPALPHNGLQAFSINHAQPHKWDTSFLVNHAQPHNGLQAFSANHAHSHSGLQVSFYSTMFSHTAGYKLFQ
jgi:hypothetical protein